MYDAQVERRAGSGGYAYVADMGGIKRPAENASVH